MEPNERSLVAHEIPGGAGWSLRLRAGREVRLTALGAGANCSVLLFDAADPVDRMNLPDTLKAQMSARIHVPLVLMSDRGVGLASVTGSSLDWHDALSGHSTDAHVARFGPSSYADDRNGWRRSARSLLVSELAKYGRGPADLHATVNFFSKVATSDDDAGTLTFVANHAAAGDWVALRCEVPLLFVCATAPHPLDPRWQPAAVRVEVFAGALPGPDDPSATFRDESARALAVARAVSA